MQDYFLGLGLSPNVIHRTGAMSSGGLDSMPHVSGFVNNLQVCRLNHRQSYPSYAMVCLVIPIRHNHGACAVLAPTGYSACCLVDLEKMDLNICRKESILLWSSI